MIQRQNSRMMLALHWPLTWQTRTSVYSWSLHNPVCECPAQCLHQDSCLHRGYVPLRFCQKTKFLNGGSAKNRIQFGLKLGCHSIPWVPPSTLSGENAGPFCAFCWMKRTQILENIILFVFLDCWSFLVPLSVLPGANSKVLNYLSGAVGSCICKYFD